MGCREIEQVSWREGLARNKSIRSLDISSDDILSKGFSAMNLPHVKSTALDCRHFFALGLRKCKSLEAYVGVLTVDIVTALEYSFL